MKNTLESVSYEEVIEIKKALRAIYKNQKRLEEQMKSMREDDKVASDARFPQAGSYHRIHA